MIFLMQKEIWVINFQKKKFQNKLLIQNMNQQEQYQEKIQFKLLNHQETI